VAARSAGPNLKHLVTVLGDLQALGIAFVSLAEGIDATTPAGKLHFLIFRLRLTSDTSPWPVSVCH
jgi:DNA invertase Pin-like site-specific DNA recombinase